MLATCFYLAWTQCSSILPSRSPSRPFTSWRSSWRAFVPSRYLTLSGHDVCYAAAAPAVGITATSAFLKTTAAKTSTDTKAMIELIARSGSTAVKPKYTA